MSNEMATTAGNEVMAADEIVKQVNIIQQMMKAVMTGPTKENPAGVHYGLVPGCGNKPTLLKPGAEKLRLMFKLRAIIRPEDIEIEHLDGGHRTYTIRTHITNRNGEELATGVGLCSTLESKFRYRGGSKVLTDTPVPAEYWNLKKEGKLKEAADCIGGRGFGVAKNDAGAWVVCELGAKTENPDIADTYNTVLKMAKKRSDVDGTISALAASDIFAQDVEEMAENAQAAGTHTPPPATATESTKTATAAAPKSGTLIGVVEKYIEPTASKTTGKFGPHKVIIGGKYYDTFDKAMGEVMAAAPGKEVEISFRTENYRGVDKYVLESILPITDVGGENDGE